jgi:hypothetical protein
MTYYQQPKHHGMNQKIHDILRKINYIEADIEIQKQILFSLPADEKNELERIIKKIAVKKDEIVALRNVIHELSPEEHNRIVVFENAVALFKKIADGKKFKTITTLHGKEECCLSLKRGETIHCLVKACDEGGEWTIITMTGELQHFTNDEVDQLPMENPA